MTTTPDPQHHYIEIRPTTKEVRAFLRGILRKDEYWYITYRVDMPDNFIPPQFEHTLATYAAELFIRNTIPTPLTDPGLALMEAKKRWVEGYEPYAYIAEVQREFEREFILRVLRRDDDEIRRSSFHILNTVRRVIDPDPVRALSLCQGPPNSYRNNKQYRRLWRYLVSTWLVFEEQTPWRLRDEGLLIQRGF